MNGPSLRIGSSASSWSAVTHACLSTSASPPDSSNSAHTDRHRRRPAGPSPFGGAGTVILPGERGERHGGRNGSATSEKRPKTQSVDTTQPQKSHFPHAPRACPHGPRACPHGPRACPQGLVRVLTGLVRSHAPRWHVVS